MWKDHIAHLMLGSEGWWHGESIDPRQQGEDYRREGRAKRDPYLLRQAALAYRTAGDEYTAGKCLALAYEMEENYVQAGDEYRELDLYDEAFRCYWIGREWSRLRTLTAEKPGMASRLESRAADFMIQRGLPVTFLEKPIDASKDDDWLSQLRDNATWRFVLQEVAKRIQRVKNGRDLPWPGLWDAFKRFHKKISFNPSHLAMISYRAGEFAEASKLWKEAGDTQRGEYLDARARSTPFPENIIWFAQLKNYKENLRQWYQNRANISDIRKIDEGVIRAVVDAAIEENDIALAAQMVELLPVDKNKRRIARVLTAAVQVQANDLVTRICAFAAQTFVRTRNWSAAVKAAEEADFSSLPEVPSDKVRAILRESGGLKVVFKTVVKELAISEDLPREKAELQSLVSNFLRRNFIGEGSFPDLQ